MTLKQSKDLSLNKKAGAMHTKSQWLMRRSQWDNCTASNHRCKNLKRLRHKRGLDTTMGINVIIRLGGILGFAGLALFLAFLSEQAGNTGFAILFMAVAVLVVFLFMFLGRQND